MYSVLTPLLPDLAQSLRLTKAMTGVLFSAYMIGVVCGSLVAVPLIKFLGCRRTAQLTLVVIGASGVGLALSGTFTLAVVFRTLAGVAGGAAWVAAMTWLLVGGPAERRGETLGTVMSVAVAGTLIGPLIGNAAVGLGQLPVFAVVAALSVWAAVALPADPGSTRSAAQVRDGTRVRRGQAQWILAGSVWTLALLAFVYGAMYVLLPLRLAAHGQSGLLIGWIFAGCSILSAMVNRGAGQVVDRYGTHWLLAISMTSGALALVVLALSQVLWLDVVMVVAAIGFALALGMSPNAAAVSLDAEHLGLPGPTTSMILLLTFSVGEALGGVVVPVVAQASSDSAALLMLITALLLSLVVVRCTARARSRAR